MGRTVFGAATLAALAAAPAGAQEIEAGGALALEPIEVFGARNAQTLDDLPASVGIVTAEDIQTRGLTSFREAFRMLGNVMDSDWVDSGFIIRGVNSEGLTPGGAPLASFYVDGIQQTGNGARRGARGLFDVEQVEVYRGPQSTLSGRAALAGAIYVKTMDPTYDYEVKAQAGLGSEERKETALAVNAPLVEDQVALRIAGEFERQDNDISYQTYKGFDRYDDLVTDEYYQIRGKLLVEPAALPDTRALLTYSFAHDSPNLDDIGGPGLGFDFDDWRGDFNAPVFAEVREADNHNLGIEVTHDLTSTLTLTSLTTYTHSDTDRSSVNAGTAGETDVLRGDQKQDLATQEVRLNYYGEGLSGVAGLYFAYEEDDNQFVRPDFFDFASDVSKGSNEAWNVAGFGEATYEFLPSWKVVLGGRLDYTDQKGSSFFSRNGEVTTDFDFSSDDLVALPKLGLIKQLAPQHSTGVTVQRGFRVGGAGIQRSTGDEFTFDPEYTWTYEAFYKGLFADGRLRVGANVFYTDWEDQQVEVQADPADFSSTFITNAGSSQSYGFEVDTHFAVTEEISTFASVGFLQTEFDDFETATLGDLSGEWFPEAPTWSIAFGAQYFHATGLYVGADAKYTSEVLARFGNPPQEYLDGYVIANLQAGWQGERFGAQVYAENVFDEHYFTFNDNDIAATLGPRRVIGVRGSVSF